jgi:hypothetical protein
MNQTILTSVLAAPGHAVSGKKEDRHGDASYFETAARRCSMSST